MSKFDIGIDLGTTNVKIFVKDRGVVLSEPSVVAIKKKTGKLFEIGEKAYEMIGKTPESIIIKHPVSMGVIVDHELNRLMIKELLSRVLKKSIKKSRVCICFHRLMTDVQIKALAETALSSGCGKVFLIEESVASGLGAGIDILKTNGVMIVNIGGGTTDISLLTFNGVVVSRSIKAGGQNIDGVILKNIANCHNLLIGMKTAERAKIKIATVKLPNNSVKYKLSGKDIATGLPKSVVITQCDIFDQLKESIELIVENIKEAVGEAPPEIAADIYENGILLTGGGSLIDGLPELVSEKIGVKARLADRPTDCVINGVGKSFDMIDNFNLDFVRSIV